MKIFKKTDNTLYLGEINIREQQELETTLKMLIHDNSNKTLVAPINNSTWFSYRVVYESDKTVPFFLMEPQNPDFYHDTFLALGFKLKESYHSSISPLKEVHDSRFKRVLKRLQNDGIVIRNIDLNHFEDELANLYHLTHNSFKNNPFYEAISQKEFIALYLEFKPLVQPELCKIVEYQNKIIGYMFAYHDNNCLVIKTTAFKPLKISAGITLVLMEMMSEYSLKKGCSHIIYALMHDNNHSAKTAHKNARIFRRYALYEYKKSSE